METLTLVKTLDQLNQLSDYIKDKEFIAFDTETTGTAKTSKVIGFSISCDVDIGYYVILSAWNVEKNELIDTELASQAKRFLELLVGRNIICHNGIFDCAIVESNYGIKLIDSLHTDTMVLSHLLDETRSHALKELGVSIFGDDAKKEQIEMKESVTKNGGSLTKKCYELYKADVDLIGLYGAKDAILTLKLFFEFVPQLYEQGLDTFFYEEETMPLLRGSTYALNTTGIKIDPDKLRILRGTLETEIMEAKTYIYKEIAHHIKDKYPGTNKTNTFNIGASKQIAWLLYDKLNNDYVALTPSGRELCKALEMKLPFTPAQKTSLIRTIVDSYGQTYIEKKYNAKTKKIGIPKKVTHYWHYLSADKDSLTKLAPKYKWIQTYLEYAKNTKLLKTYVTGIENKVVYNIIHPSFLQHGTTSGRYSSKVPNFQNLPRDDKRVKSVVVSRPGRVFVGADYSQLEPRVFASVSQDPTLLNCFKTGQDFYSVVGMPMFDKTDCSPYKKDPNAFATKYPELRNIAKAFALATPYGTSPFQQALKLNLPLPECQNLILKYFESYPLVEAMMLDSHEKVKKDGVVHSLYGRPRRIPEAKDIRKLYGKATHAELPYNVRNLLNLAMNHRVQSSAASIMNRASIAMHNDIKKKGLKDCNIVLQVHDELIVECREQDADLVSNMLKDAMENTTVLPGVDLIAEPKIAHNLADLK